MAQDALRAVYDEIYFVKNFCREHGIPLEKMGAFITNQRITIHRLNRYSVDPLENSMRHEWRHSFSEDGESGYDYRILEDLGETEDEIREMCEAIVGYPPINSPYDCTGKRFTCWISVHRVPAGFAVIHRWGLDV